MGNRTELQYFNGISALSDADYTKYKNENSHRIPQYLWNKASYSQKDQLLNKLYKKDKFISLYGEEAWNNTPKESRDNFVLNSAVANIVDFDDPNYKSVLDMTPEGKMELLESSYLSQKEVDERAAKESNAVDATRLGWLGPSGSSMEAAYMEFNKDSLFNTKDELLDSDNKLLDNILKKDTNRKIENSRQEAFQIRDAYTKALESGQITEEEIDKYIEEVLQYSPYYREFKGTKTLENFGFQDKLNIFSNFMAVQQKYGDNEGSMESAYKALNNQFQDYVSENQTAIDWAMNTYKNVAVGTVAALMNTYIGAVALYTRIAYGEEGLAQYLQGKDTDGSDLWNINNPLYWQGVDQFNTLDAKEINRIRENGGISRYNNIVKSGEELDLMSWNTINEVIKQQKYLYAGLIEAVALRGLGKVLSPLAKGTGALAKTMRFTGAIAELGVQASNQAALEGLSAFQESLQSFNEIIDKRVQNDVSGKMTNFVGTEDWNNLVSAKKEELRKNKIEELKNKYGERYMDYALTISDKDLEAEAMNIVNNSLETQFKEEAEALYTEDRKNAELSAATAYQTTATLNTAKTAITNGFLKKWLFSKGTREALGMNGPRPNIIEDAQGLLRSEGLTNWQKYGRPVVNALGEGVDEFMDSYVNNLGQGFAAADFKDYMSWKYDPKNYVEGMDNMLFHFFKGVDTANETFYSPEAYYEGGIGLLSGGTGISPQFQNMFSKSGWKSIKQAFTGVDSEGNPVSMLERVNSIINNPILNDINEVRAIENNTKREIGIVNQVLENNRQTLEDITTLVGTLSQAERAETSGSVLEALDSKLQQSFELITALESLGASELASQSSLYRNAVSVIDRLAEGNITQDDIVNFLGHKENKSLENNPNKEEIAKAKLQENAQLLKKRQVEYRENLESLDKDPNTRKLLPSQKAQLVFLKMAGKDWESRKNSMLEELGLSSSNSSDYRYLGNSVNIKMNSITSSINSLQSELEENTNKLNKINKDLQNTSTTSEEYASLQQEKRELEFVDKVLTERISDLQIEEESLNSFSNPENTILSKDEILGLNAEQLSFMLDEKNKDSYSKEQLKEINAARNELIARDPSALQKIKDIASLDNRISSINRSFSNMIQNPDMLLAYERNLEQARTYALNNYYREKALYKVEEYLDNLEGDENLVIGASNLSVAAIDHYINKHPEKAELLKESRAKAQLLEDAKAVIDSLVEDKSLSKALKESLVNTVFDSKTLEEALDAIDSVVLSDNIDPTTRNYFNGVLKKLKDVEDQRVVTKITAINESRRKRKEKLKREKEAREELERRAKEAANKPKETEEEVVPEEPAEETMEEPENIPTEENIISIEDAYFGNINMVNSPALEEQISDTNGNLLETITLQSTEDVDLGFVEYEESDLAPTLSGNAINAYERTPLDEQRKLVPRKGKEPNDSMNRFLNWCKNEGIDYQFVIDNELSDITKVQPKIQFLTVNPNNNATNDKDLQNYVLNVVEYTDEVSKIHDRKRGGILKANGKEWLVVGVLGGSNKRTTKEFKERVLPKMNTVERGRYFFNNPKERFYVDPNMYTQVQSIKAGRRARQLEKDTKAQQRSILEILEDIDRNPNGEVLEDLKWGIQYYSQFLPVNFSNSTPHHIPKDVPSNAGRLFLMTKDADGRLFPIAMDFKFYQDIPTDSRYYKMLMDLILNLTDSNHSVRLDAIRKLSNYLHFDDKKNILIGKSDNNTISIIDGGVARESFNLDDPNFDKARFLELFKEANFIVNFTASNLNNLTELKMMAEAGLLTTDIATLSDTGGEYRVYNIDNNGNPIIFNTPNNLDTKQDSNSDYSRVQRRAITYGYIVYRQLSDGSFEDKNGNKVSDESLIEKLNYALYIQENALNPVITSGVFDYYIINQDLSNPIVVKQHRSTKEVFIANKEEATKLIEKITREKLEKEREENANKALEESKVQEETVDFSAMDITLGDDILLGDEESTIEDINIEESVERKEATDTTYSTTSLPSTQIEEGSKTFLDILDSEEYSNRLYDIFDAKAESGEWQNVPQDVDEMVEYLNKKGIITKGISNIESWLKMLEECK